MALARNIETFPGEESPMLTSVPPHKKLSDVYHFDLGNTEVVIPEDSRATVVDEGMVDTIVVDTEDGAQQVEVHRLMIDDPFVGRNPEVLEKLSRHIESTDRRIAEDGVDVLAERQQKHSYADRRDPGSSDNIYTAAWKRDNAALAAWHTWKPMAPALEYTTDPRYEGEILNRQTGKMVPMDKVYGAYMIACADAVGLRARAAGQQHLAVDHIEQQSNPDLRDAQWVSLASGTAKPSMKAVKEINDRYGAGMRLSAVDYDPEALAYVEGLAAQIGLDPNSVATEQFDLIRNKQYASALMEILGLEEGAAFVENSGFLEYLWEEGDELGAYRQRKALPQASEFTQQAWEMTAQDGVLLSANMELDRPQIPFIFGTIYWELINARGKESFVRIFDHAGLLVAKNELKLYEVVEQNSGFHVYNLAKLVQRD